MGKFLESEKPRQAAFKLSSGYFSSSARKEGVYKGKPRPFCLPRECAEENLFEDIRQPALSFFKENGIKWHDGEKGLPSNHLCDSQVCCLNFLFPFANQPEALRDLLRPIFPTVQRMLPVEHSQYVTFEWIGLQNYLGEKIRGNSRRTRGANFTSADAAVILEQRDGKRRLVLIEWKYTESYGGSSLRVSKNGTDRTKIYSHLYRKADCPLNKTLVPSFPSLFYEPFYQFMRQQLLAHEMELAHELNADISSVLHIAPAHNKDFQKVTSSQLDKLGESAIDVWKKLVGQPERFSSATTEMLFGRLAVTEHPQLSNWWKYVIERYPWVL